MDEEIFNMSMRKFLKEVGVTSQQQIETAVRKSGKTSGRIPVRMVLTAEAIGLEHVVTGEIGLGG
ncbi:MAG: hypothetical protein KDJ46_03845 [Rhodobiaceae bacterium]|nr:hypothetical protein [Rhodobiaceae bacterium]